MIGSRGSEWNRWDFHIHTPGTLKNDQFTGMTIDKKWDNFYNDIISYIDSEPNGQHKIVAVGITDYLSVKNYLKVISDGVLPSKIPFIFPNVELRIMLMGERSPINMHCLFNPKIANELEARFFSKLKFSRGDTCFSAAESELIRFGNTIDKSLNNEAALRLAANQFLIPHTQLKELFEQDIELRKNTIIAISNKSTDGASGIANQPGSSSNSQLYETRAELYRMSDFIFSAILSCTFLLPFGISDKITLVFVMLDLYSSMYSNLSLIQF